METLAFWRQKRDMNGKKEEEGGKKEREREEERWGAHKITIQME